MKMLKYHNELQDEQWKGKNIDKYWSDSKRDIFQNKSYVINFNNTFLDEWDDLGYLIRRGRVEEVKEVVKYN